MCSYFTTVFVSLGVFLFGYDQGVMSGIITYVTPSTTSNPKNQLRHTSRPRTGKLILEQGPAFP